ncbi:MAG: hypothetical protein LC118_21020 [Dehalococcoidia bacterium]|nr:hypothetical protein [Dehalococcoidia bacterium]
MNDAIALLAISQLVCLAAIFYLYTQVQGLKAHPRGKRVTISPRAHPMGDTVDLAAQQATAARAAREAYAARTPRPERPARPRADVAPLAGRLAEMGVDIPALARRMQKSEEEVRLLLRRQGMAR